MGRVFRISLVLLASVLALHLFGGHELIRHSLDRSGFFDSQTRSKDASACADASSDLREVKWETVCSRFNEGFQYLKARKIEPSDSLNWEDCYGGNFTCARLKVPLNYSEPTGQQAVIALVRQVSPLDTKSAEYRGPILFNPGGPGGSGVGLVQQRADQLRTLVGPSFDLIGFDPRGVAASTPKVSFFSSEAERRIYLQDPAEHISGSTREDLAKAWARQNVVGQLAAESNEASGHLQHINTENTARDMLYITEKYGYEKIQYMGYSYGTVLGSTFASLFPDKIERLIIDGVVDVDNYYEGRWDNNLMDTEDTWQAFSDGCFTAGPDLCAFWFDSPSRIYEEVQKLYDVVRKEPVSVRTSKGYGIIGYKQLRAVIFSSLYKPWGVYPKLANALAELRNSRNGTALLELLSDSEPFECSCSPYRYVFAQIEDATPAIACNDALDVEPGLEEFLEYSAALRNATSWADAWERIHLECTSYPRWPKTHFQGPVGASSTSHPILLIGNTADPVTPLWAAKKIGARFPGSVVLTQDSPGHCSLAAPSICTSKIVQAYMVNGTLPDEGTVCDVDIPIFAPEEKKVLTSQSTDAQVPFSQKGLDSGDIELLKSLVKFARSERTSSGPLSL